jgi:hypothetical protein
MDGYIPSPYSNQSGMSSHTKNYSKLLLPSYEKVKHDPDTSPNGFRPWAKQFRDITVANFGQPARALFNFVDLKAGRRSERQEQTMLQTVPDIYLAEGLAPRAQNAPPRHMGSRGSPLGASTATDFDNPAVGDASVTVGSLPGQAVMGSPVSGASAQDIHYDDAAQFTPEMDELNRFLYISLNNSYVGSKGTRLPDVPEAYCLFHYAMIHLWSMDKKNIAARKIQAVEAFGKIQFTGDAMKWKYDVLEAIREVYATEYNLNDFIYQGVIDQLKNKDPETLILLTKQLNILNSSEDPSAPQNWETNLAPVVDYLVTSKAVLGGNAPIQAVLPPKGPGKPPATGPPPGMTWSTEPKDPTCIDMVCGNCRQPNHHRRKNCPMGHLDTGPTCDYCHNKGHSSNDCRKKVRDEKRPSPVNSVNPASARAELLSQLASLDAKGKDSSTNYVRSGEEVMRTPDPDPVTLPELHGSMDQDKDDDNPCPDPEPGCPSHGLVQEGRSDSRPGQVAQEAFQKRFEDDLRRLMALTYEQPSEEIDIPEGSATSEPSTPPTEEMRNATVFTTKSDLTEDLNGNKKRIDLESISPASPQGTIIMNPSATFEPPAPSTKEALEQYAEVVPPENPDEFSKVLEQPVAKNKQLEADPQAYKALDHVPPSITDPLEPPKDMVKIIGQGASQKGKSWSDTPGLPTATLPVSSRTPDLGNIIKEVSTTSADQHKSTAIVEEGPLRAKSEAGSIINAPSAVLRLAQLTAGAEEAHADLMSCAATSMQKASIPINRDCAAELNLKARTIASHASPKTDLIPWLEQKDLVASPTDLIPWLEQQGLVKESNEKGIYYHPERDVTLLVYVDDVLAYGEQTQIDWIFQLMDERFGQSPGLNHSLANAFLDDSIKWIVDGLEPRPGADDRIFKAPCWLIARPSAVLTKGAEVFYDRATNLFLEYESPDLPGDGAPKLQADIAAFSADSVVGSITVTPCGNFSKMRPLPMNWGKVDWALEVRMRKAIADQKKYRREVILPSSESFVQFVQDRQKQSQDSGGTRIPQCYSWKAPDGTTGMVLLGAKMNGMIKARAVKQGFKSSNALSVLQPKDDHDDQGLWIDNGQVW